MFMLVNAKIPLKLPFCLRQYSYKMLENICVIE